MDLNRASTFVRVVEAGGFTRAAEALGLPPSSISRSVARLEADLGVTLLERTTRKVSLTDAGRAYFERAREALAGLAEATDLALDAAQQAFGVVRIAMPTDLGVTEGTLLAPFLAAHPRIRIELTFTNRGAELVGDLVDLAVVIGRLPDSSLLSRRLGAAPSRLFAAPAYLASRPRIRGLADLATHDGLSLRALAGEARWELLGPDGPTTVDVPARLVGDQLPFLLDAACAGLGIALLPAWMGDRAVADGRLAVVLPAFSAELPLHVLTHAGRHLPRRVGLVRDHLTGSLAGQCTARAGLVRTSAHRQT